MEALSHLATATESRPTQGIVTRSTIAALSQLATPTALGATLRP
jgi:hypothetical protein